MSESKKGKVDMFPRGGTELDLTGGKNELIVYFDSCPRNRFNTNSLNLLISYSVSGTALALQMN